MDEDLLDNEKGKDMPESRKLVTRDAGISRSPSSVSLQTGVKHCRNPRHFLPKSTLVRCGFRHNLAGMTRYAGTNLASWSRRLSTTASISRMDPERGGTHSIYLRIR
jgi:hypothetical protein